VRIFFELGDIIGFSLVIVFPVREERVVLVSEMASCENTASAPSFIAHLDITMRFQGAYCL